MTRYRVRASSNGTIVELVLDAAGGLRPLKSSGNGAKRRKTRTAAPASPAQSRPRRNTAIVPSASMAPATDD